MQKGDRVGRFVLDHEAGVGGMGRVYRALDESSGAVVAVKVLHATATEAQERFDREVRVLQGIRHPGIVKYVAHGTSGDGQRYLVMEWLDGEPLGRRIAAGAMPVRDVLDVGREIAEALGAAHSIGIVHRDVKPQNIMVLRRGGVKILDFGIARRFAQTLSLTRTGMVVGSFHYMSPEQALGNASVDARSDIFSLGCVLYECITGRRAFHAHDATAVLAKILLDAPLPIPEIRPSSSSSIARARSTAVTSPFSPTAARSSPSAKACRWNEAGRGAQCALAVRAILRDRPVALAIGLNEASLAARGDTRALGDGMRAAFEEWLLLHARRAPTILVLEDLHWGDLPTIRFVDAALRNLASQPLFVLALGRPEVNERFPNLWKDHSLLQLSLGPLSRKAQERPSCSVTRSSARPRTRSSPTTIDASGTFSPVNGSRSRASTTRSSSRRADAGVARRRAARPRSGLARQGGPTCRGRGSTRRKRALDGPSRAHQGPGLAIDVPHEGCRQSRYSRGRRVPPRMSSHDNRRVVIAALAGNLAIMACKFAAAYLSGSTATLAEAVHSVADSGNQLLLLLGIRLASQPANERFAFGRAAEQYFWPFVVALMLFSVGGAFGVYEGVQHLLAPRHDEVRMLTVLGFTFPSNWLNYAVLGTSAFFEALSFRVAFGEFKLLAKGKSYKDTILEARDPTIPLVLVEDMTALVGLSIALVAVILHGITGHEIWDALGSLIIGILLAFVAWTLAKVTHGLLIGASATTEEQAEALAVTEGTPGVQKVTQLLTLHLGPDVIVLAMKIAFDPELKARGIEDVTNEIEKRIRKQIPKMRKIFIEVDAHGDMRGIEAARKVIESTRDVSDTAE